MNKSYWNGIAADYETEIFNVFANDKFNRLESLIKAYAHYDKPAADFGCGVGNGLALLSRYCGHIDAYDLSNRNIQRCKLQLKTSDTIHFSRANLSTAKLSPRYYSFGLCVSVLIMPEMLSREKILANMQASMRRGGHLLCVVPSLESLHYINAKTVEWNRQRGLSPAKSLQARFDSEPRVSTEDLRQGVMPLDGVRTKHYIREEIERVGGQGFALERLEKIEYSWDCVFEGLPRELSKPLPWDWAFVLRVR